MEQAGEEPRRLLREVLAEGLGVPEDVALELVGRAQWGAPRVRSELAEPGWQERLRSAAAAATEERVASKLRSVLENGPSLLAEKSLAELSLLISVPRLGEFAEKYNPYTHGGRLVLGPTGIGKSAACVAVVRRLVAGDIEAAYAPGPPDENLVAGLVRRQGGRRGVRWARAFDVAKAQLEHSFGDGEVPLLRELASVRFLVLDDLGWESRRAGADDCVVELLARRYDAGLVTCATSGLRMDQFTERYGEAVMRRIIENRGPMGKVLDLWPKESKQ